jgi:predicted metal-dependent phosphoesterase TrpH
MDHVTFTDHDTVQAFEMLGWKKEKLTPGVELSVTDMCNVGHTVHINVFELDGEQFRDVHSIATKAHDIFMVIDFLKENDLLYMYNTFQVRK